MKRILLLSSFLFFLLSSIAYAEFKPVEIDLFVMSQCPFAVQVENTFLQIKEQMKKNLNINLYFIAQEQEGKFKSLHGKKEVEEDMRQLIIHKYFPRRFFRYLRSRNTDYRGQDWQKHAIFAGLNPQKIEYLVKKEGRELLRENIKRAQKLHIFSSPTIFINGERYEGSYSLPSLIIAIREKLSEQEKRSFPWKNLPRCFSDEDCHKKGKRGRCLSAGTSGARCVFSPLSPVTLTILSNKDFDSRVIEEWRRVVPSLRVKKLSYNSQEGKEVLKELGLDVLPVYILSKSVEELDNFQFYKARGLLIQKGEKYILNPQSVEINYYPYRKRKKKNLKLFVMSKCPFGIEAENEILPLARKRKVEVEIYYIASYNKQRKEWESLHGTAEAEEDMRQLCIKKYFPEKYFDYILLRNKNVHSSLWEKVARKVGIDDEKIRECQYNQGEELLRKNSKFSEELGINASPTILWENTRRFNNLKEFKDNVEMFKDIRVKYPGRCR